MCQGRHRIWEGLEALWTLPDPEIVQAAASQESQEHDHQPEMQMEAQAMEAC